MHGEQIGPTEKMIAEVEELLPGIVNLHKCQVGERGQPESGGHQRGRERGQRAARQAVHPAVADRQKQPVEGKDGRARHRGQIVGEGERGQCADCGQPVARASLHMERRQGPQADGHEQQCQNLGIVADKVEGTRQRMGVEQIERGANQARGRAEREAKPAVYAETRQDERRGHHEFERLIQPDSGPVDCPHQPIQGRAVVVKGGRAQAVVDGWKPARPINPLLEGARYSCAAVRMQLLVRRASR